MELSIKTCPACDASVIGDERVCSSCGKELPVEDKAGERKVQTLVSPTEIPCPKCGGLMPKGVLRCRDCGSYMSADIEATMMAKQMMRGYQMPAGYRGLAGGGAAFGSGFVTQPVQPSASFAEVADDADFDLHPEVDVLDRGMQSMVDQQNYALDKVADATDDDFEMGDGTADVGYAVAAPQAPETPSETPPAAAAAAEASPAVSIPVADGPIPASLADPAGAPPVLGSEVSHSVQTAGDVLLEAALEEERDTQTRMKGGKRRLRRSTTTALGPDSFLVFCPNGHRIQVHNKHRGRTGRCPNCKSMFFVPQAETNQAQGEAGGSASVTPEGAAPAAEGSAPTAYQRWITDVRLHRVNPAKLKLVPGSLEGEYEATDISASAEHLLLAVLFTGGGPFRSMQEPKKKAAARDSMLAHFKTGLPVADLPVPKKHTLSPDQLQQLKIVQPSIPGEESLFADVPVFGNGRIALRVPAIDAEKERGYLSFTLSQFREFSALLADAFGLVDFGGGTAIPMTDDLQEATCHYSETVMQALPEDKLVFYKADPAIKLTVLGRRCEKCQLVVSEDSRKKEKIGGSSDASVAKARCPKCKQKFGSITLYGLPG
ncbi:MAG: hypothetical protein ACKV0T_21030 [Planctomycetales bacterium]